METVVPALAIKLTKHTDGSVVLHCQRGDGSATWQRHRGAQARFFPLHDLTHFAVESELGMPRGFYGLIAEGWSIPDTSGKGERGPLPAEASGVELVVGWLDMERASATQWRAEQLNQHTATFAAKAGQPAPRAIGEDELERARNRAQSLHGRWAALPPDGTLELFFEPRPTIDEQSPGARSKAR